MASKPPRSRRVVTRLLVVLASVAVAGAILYAARDRVLAPLILRLARGAVAEHLHADLTLSGLEGNWITHLVVEDVTIEPTTHSTDGTRPIVAVQGGRLEARYSPWGLLTGGIEGLREVQLSARNVVLAPAAAPVAEEPDAAPDGAGALPAHLPRIRVDVDLLEVLLDSERTLTAEALAVDAEDDRFRLDASLTWRDPSRTVAAPAALEGRYDPELVAFDALRLGELLDLSSGSVTLPPAPLAVQAEGTLLQGSVTASLTKDAWELSLGDVLLDAVAPLIATDLVLTGRADLTGQGALDGSTADARLAARDLLAGAVHLEELRADVELTPDEVRVPRVNALRGDNSLEGEGWTIPREPFGPFELLRHIEGRLLLTVGDVPDLLAAEAPGVLPHRITLDGTLGQGLLAVETGELRTEAGLLTVSRGSLRLGEADAFGDAELALEMTADFDELAQLARLFGEESVQGGLAGTLVVDGKLRSLRGRMEGNVSRLLVRELELGDGEIVGTYDENDVFSLERLELAGGLGTLSLSGAYSFPDARLDDVRLQARCESLGVLGVPELTAGAVSVAAELSGPLTEPRGSVSVDGTDLIYAGSPADTLAVRGVLEGTEARLERLELANRHGSVVAAGRILQEDAGGWSATLSSLEAARGEGRLALAEAAELRFVSAEEWSLSPLVLQGDGGLARLAAEQDAGGLTSSLVCEDFDPFPITAVPPFDAWSTNGLDGSVELVLHEGALQSSFDLSVDSLRTDPQDVPWNIEAHGTLDRGRLHVELLDVEHEQVGTLTARGDVPLEPLAEVPLGPGELQLESSFELDFDALCRRIGGLPPELAGRIRGEADLGGEWRAARGRVSLASDDISLAAFGKTFEGSLASLRLELVADADGCRLSPASLSAPTLGRIEAQGTLATSLDLAAILTGDGLEWRETPLDLQLELALDDTSWLAHYTGAVRRTGGRLNGRLDITGPAGDPDLDGTLTLAEGALRFAGSSATLERLGAEVGFREHVVTLHAVQGELGGSPLSGEGTIDFTGEEPVLSLQVQGQNLLLVRESGLRLRADTDVEVAGPLSQITTTGKVVLTEGRYSRDVDFLGSLRGEAAPPSAGGRGFLPILWREGPLARMTLDIQVESRSPFLIKNNVTAFELRPELLLHGTGQVPLLVGTIYIDPGYLSLPSGWLNIESGRLDFREDAPFAPLLELIGKTRIKGHDIGVRVSGTAVRPEVELWSTPPLPGDDLLVLFLTGELPETSTAEGAAQSVAVYLAKDYITRWMRGQGEDDDTILRRIEVNVGADVTRSGAPTTEIIYYVSERPRGIGWVPFLSAARDKYDHFNMGVGVLFRLR